MAKSDGFNDFEYYKYDPSMAAAINFIVLFSITASRTLLCRLSSVNFLADYHPYLHLGSICSWLCSEIHRTQRQEDLHQDRMEAVSLIASGLATARYCCSVTSDGAQDVARMHRTWLAHHRFLLLASMLFFMPLKMGQNVACFAKRLFETDRTLHIRSRSDGPTAF